jgi:hypothetical protein
MLVAADVGRSQSRFIGKVNENKVFEAFRVF